MDNSEVFIIAKITELEARLGNEVRELHERINKVRDHINDHVGRTLIMLMDKQGVQIDSQWRLVDKKEGAGTPNLGGSYSGGHFV